MNRDKILNTYEVDGNGIITSPGEFEGQIIYAPYYWDIHLDSSRGTWVHSKFCGLIDYFEVNDDDRNQFPEIPKNVTMICLWANKKLHSWKDLDHDGFIDVKGYESKEAEDIIQIIRLARGPAEQDTLDLSVPREEQVGADGERGIYRGMKTKSGYRKELFACVIFGMVIGLILSKCYTG